MAFITEDRVMETATTTGTGDFTLAGAVSGYRAFSAVCSTGDLIEYVIDGGTEWESGVGTYSAANTLTRTTVFESTNAGAAVNFSAGSKYVFTSRIARFSQPYLLGNVATTSGTSVSFTSIPQYYKSLNLEFLGVSHDNGANQTLQIEHSPDASTWTSAQNCSGSAAATTQWYGGIWIPDYTKGACVSHYAVSNLSTDNSSGVPTGGNIVVRMSAGVQAIRVSPSAGNFDAGSINLWGHG